MWSHFTSDFKELILWERNIQSENKPQCPLWFYVFVAKSQNINVQLKIHFCKNYWFTIYQQKQLYLNVIFFLLSYLMKSSSKYTYKLLINHFYISLLMKLSSRLMLWQLHNIFLKKKMFFKNSSGNFKNGIHFRHSAVSVTNFYIITI